MGPKRNGNRKKRRQRGEQAEDPPPPAKKQPAADDDDGGSDGDDEEIDEDGAFNSDDERRFGALFAADRSGGDDDGESEEDLDDDDDDDDEEGDGGQYMLNLLNNLDNDNDDKATKDGNGNTATTAHVRESPFAATAASGGAGAGAAVTLDSLLDGLRDTPGFGRVQRHLKAVAAAGRAAAVAAPVVADRALRHVRYEHQKRQMGDWQAAVREHRRAETLDFRPQRDRGVTSTRDALVGSFVPETDFERELHAALQRAGAADDEAGVIKREEREALLAGDDDLGSAELTAERLRERRGQLAKMRALLFYHEQKRHRANKIKSRQYRRVRKRQKQRAAAASEAEDPAVAQQREEERAELERARERATLAHRNTSQWARRILKRGRHADAGARRALSAQVQRGEDLRHKMQTTTERESDDGDGDSEDEVLVETAKKVLAEAEEDDNNNDDDDAKGGLFQLKFMQRGVEKQRAQARQEARQLLLELQQQDDDDDDDDDNDGGFAVPDGDDKKKRKKRPKRASREDMKQILEEGSMVASSLQHGTAGSVAVRSSSNIEVDGDAGFPRSSSSNNNKTTTTKGGGGDSDNIAAARGGLLSQHQATLSSTPSAAAKPREEGDDDKKTSSVKKHTLTTTTSLKKTAPSAQLEADESNPWLLESDKTGTDHGGTTTPTHSKVKKSAAKSTKKKKDAAVGFVDVDRAVDLLDDGHPPAAASEKEATPAPPPGAEKKITTLTQEELVRRAFATQSEREADDEFAKEKALVEEREDPLRKKRKEKELTSSSGWGSWAGAGAPPPRPRKFPKKLQPPESSSSRANSQRPRVDGRRPNLILSERRAKKTADKYMVAEIPYPFTTREEYEKSMVGGVGREWNVTSSFKDLTRPEILTRAGKVIQPISRKLKQKRAPAKF